MPASGGRGSGARKAFLRWGGAEVAGWFPRAYVVVGVVSHAPIRLLPGGEPP